MGMLHGQSYIFVHVSATVSSPAEACACFSPQQQYVQLAHGLHHDLQQLQSGILL